MPKNLSEEVKQLYDTILDDDDLLTNLANSSSPEAILALRIRSNEKFDNSDKYSLGDSYDLATRFVRQYSSVLEAYKSVPVQ